MSSVRHDLSHWRLVSVLMLFLPLLTQGTALAAPVSPVKAADAAAAFAATKGATLRAASKSPGSLRAKGAEASMKALGDPVRPITNDEGKLVAYVAALEPEGFVIVAADDRVRPVLGYSFSGRFSIEDSRDNVLLHLIQWDVSARLRAAEAGEVTASEAVEHSQKEWRMYISGARATNETEGAEETWGPWLTTEWSQGGHYNNKCPYVIPHVPGLRRPVGCVATATAQIVNYWRYPECVAFSDEEYIYVSGTRYSIADASSVYGVPTLTELRNNTCPLSYIGDADEEAYLSFAAGVKLHMDYGVLESGANTYSARDVLNSHFQFGSAVAHTNRSGVWSTYRSNIIEDLKNGCPVQIAIHKSGKTGGHSVVVDGYNSDGYFWVNMGWGGSSNAWYDIPNIGHYDVVHTAVYHIMPYRGWSQYGADQMHSFRTVYPVPVEAPERKWRRSIGLSRYTYWAPYNPLVVGTGGRLCAPASPMDQGMGNHPRIHIYDQHGTRVAEHLVSDSDYSIASLAQNEHGDIYFASAHGSANTRDKTIVYRIPASGGGPTAIYQHTSPDAGWADGPVKIDKDDNVYLCITPYFASNGAKAYSLSRTGTKRWERSFTSGAILDYSSPAIDEQNNQVYLTYWDSNTNKSSLVALDRTTGAINHTFTFPDATIGGHVHTDPAIGNDGTVFVGQYTKLYAFTPALAKKWTERDFYPAYLDHNIAIGRDGTLYSAIGKLVGGQFRTGYVRAMNPSNGVQKWETEVAPLTGQDRIGLVYAGINDCVLLSYGYNSSNVQRLAAVRDDGSSGQKIWDVEGGSTIAFGPGQTIYTIPFGNDGAIYALSVGERGDPDGLAMDYMDNSPPDLPTPLTPADQAMNQPTTVTLSWTCSDPDGHDLKYDVFVCSLVDGEEAAFVPAATQLTDNSTVLTDLRLGTQYLWTVVVTDGQAVTEGPTWSFTTLPDIDGDGVPDISDLCPNTVPGAPVDATGCPPAIPGDFDRDGDVDPIDLGTFEACASGPGIPENSPSCAGARLDGDDDVDQTDFSFVQRCYSGENVAADPNCASPAGTVFIPAGEFQMGNALSATGDGETDELPVHTIRLSAFYMDRTEVTNQQYADALNWAYGQGNLIAVTSGVVYKFNSGTSFPYCQTNPTEPLSQITFNNTTFSVVSGKANYPMEFVSWYGAVAYANWRSALSGRQLCYDLSTWDCDFSKNGYRLPTEAEWEAAARGGVPGHRFPWSDTDEIQHARANYNSDASYSYDTSPTRGYHPTFSTGGMPYTSSVGHFAPNGYGLYDVAGNVWEWCNDWYDPAYYSVSPYDNPHGPTSGSSRVLRGGTWDNYANACRVANRQPLAPNICGGSKLGLRLVIAGESPNSPPSISSATIEGALIKGQAGAVTVSCTASDADGAVQSVVVDLSAIGGSATQALSEGSADQWSWSGSVTPPNAGSQTCTFTATDDDNATGTAQASATVADMPAGPSTVLLGDGGSLNGQTVDSTYQWLRIAVADSLSGTVNAAIDCNNSPGAVVPFGYTLAPGYGWTLTPSRETQPQETERWIGPYEGNKSVPISKPVFTEKGIYFLIIGFAGRSDIGQVFSATAAGAAAVWNDGNDIGWDWDVSHYHQAQQYGYADINVWNGTTFGPSRQAANWVGIIAGDFSTISLSSGGSLNGQPVDSTEYWIEVDPGEQVVGTVNVDVVCLNSPGATVVMGYTATWGDRTTQSVQTHSWSGPRAATLSISIDKTAPSVSGEYYLPISLAGRYNIAQVMSATSAGATAQWGDGNDVGWDWNNTHRQQARDWGVAAQETLNPNGKMYYSPQAATWIGVRVR